MFLENLLSMVKGKFEVRGAKEKLEEVRISTQRIAEQFIDELVYSIKLVGVGRNSYE
jgi:hypothetical protein